MQTFNLDNRGLEPPEPMVRILTIVTEFEAGDELIALMDREPLLLYPELERRALDWSIDEESDHYVLKVWRS